MSYPSVCGLCFHRPSAKKTDEGLYVCRPCFDQIEAIKNEDPTVVDRERRDPSELCVRCGLCCVVLSAMVEEDEAREAHRQAVEKGIGPESFDDVFMIEGYGPNEGEYVFRFPCTYLRGRLNDYVSCAIYGLDRPMVCRSYLCKIAMRFALGMITLEEAQFTLRSSFLIGDIGLFNWVHSNDPDLQEQDNRDRKLIVYDHLNQQARRLLDEGVPRDTVGLIVASQVTPMYLVRDDPSQVLLNMHLAAFDRSYVEPSVYVDKEIVEGWTPDQRIFANQIIHDVLEQFRELFVTAADMERIENDERSTEAGCCSAEGADEGEEGEERIEGEEDEAESGDISDDVDQRGRDRVQPGGQHPRGARAGEGQGGAADAEGEPHLDPAPGSGDGSEGADLEGRER